MHKKCIKMFHIFPKIFFDYKVSFSDSKFRCLRIRLRALGIIFGDLSVHDLSVSVTKFFFSQIATLEIGDMP
jgi:uncharacterized ferritin-like protein (DUF455 family)